MVPNGSGILNKNQFTSGANQFIHPNLSLFQNLHVVSELGCLSCPSRCSCFVLGLNLFGSKWTWYLLLIQFTWGAKHFNPSVHLFHEIEVFFFNQFVWFPEDLVFILRTISHKVPNNFIPWSFGGFFSPKFIHNLIGKNPFYLNGSGNNFIINNSHIFILLKQGLIECW